MNTENTRIENVRKSCTVAAKVLKVIQIFLAVCMIFAFVGSGICYGLHSRIDADLSSNPQHSVSEFDLNVNVIGLNVNYDLSHLIEQGNYGVAFGTMALLGGLVLLFAMIVVKLVRNIFVTILESESPFSQTVIDKLKKSFIIVTVMVLLGNGLGAGLFFAMFFWCIYTIFQYGSELQLQADETL